MAPVPRVSSRRALAAYLASRARFGIKFGLETMRAVAEALGHPQRHFPSLLVAGTNGKGSVVAYVDAVLRASGLRVGRYTSPHLVHVSELIVVGGREIAAAELAAAVGRVRVAARRLVDCGRIPAHPTYFEVLTGAAFDHFRRRRVEAALLEVGMGGRLDATNVADPVASAIVSIDWDHEQYLGDTLGAIAREKGGVMRAGRATVVGRLPPEARSALVAEAARVGARLVDAWQGATLAERDGRLTIRTPRRSYSGLRPLLGAHQAGNLLVALRLLEEAEDAGLAVDAARVAEAIDAVRWPGRLQWIPGDVPLLLDGAHNAAGARALAAYLAGLPSVVLVFGVMEDKDVTAMAGALLPLAREAVLVRAPGKRAASPEAIAARAGAAAARAHRAAGLAEGLRLGRALARPGEPVVVAGSLYLVGEALRISSRWRKWSSTASASPGTGLG
jgi:dihydrofolate synthase/folylpolyglutamate synthase